MAEPARPAWEVRRLDKSHNRSSFDCGKPELNQWLHQLAGQYDRRDLARTYIVTIAGEPAVAGYYCISSHQVSYDALPEQEAKGLPEIDVPVVLLGRLAVDRSAQGQGLGEWLLMDALRRAAFIAEHVGVRAVEVHALDDDARRFYLKFGFVALRDDRRHLFLPMRVVRQLDL